ncbi:MAG: HlyC/CorC family transporter [Ruminococcus sp.]|nr:HlyC/CorC family transporter [Ruminococcus sp.]
MDITQRIWLAVIICVVLTLLIGFFTACEAAAVELTEVRLKKLLADNNKKARTLTALLEKPGRFVSANVISRSFMLAAVSAVSTYYLYPTFKNAFLRWFYIDSVTSAGYYGVCALSFALAVLAVVTAVTVLAVNIPRRLCTSGKIGERFILRSSGVYSLWIGIFMPAVKLVEVIGAVVLRAFGVKNASQQDAVTEEEIMMMVDAVNETGGIEESQAEMINNIFQFDDIDIKDAMTHRTEIIGVEEGEDIKQVIRLAIDEGKSRLPVYTENMDNICGVVFVKDLLSLALESDSGFHTAKEYMREIKFVPESNKCGELFEEFTKTRTQIAVVVDEYGGTAGIITMEDLLETIVGNIQDEYDDEEEEILKHSDGVVDFVGTADFADAMQVLGKKVPDDTEFDTIGGFVVDLLGYIPEENEKASVRWEDIEFTVLSTDETRIEKLRAVIKKDDSPREE